MCLVNFDVHADHYITLYAHHLHYNMTGFIVRSTVRIIIFVLLSFSVQPQWHCIGQCVHSPVRQLFLGRFHCRRFLPL